MSDILLLRLFELMCFGMGGIVLALYWRERSYRTLFHCGSGILFGTALELLSINLFTDYHYNPDFLLNIGKAPGQFPLFGSLLWGVIMASSFRLGERFKLGTLVAGLISYLVVVGYDFFMDVLAVRIHGGFWVWEGMTINYEITRTALFGVIWGNYFGYIFIMPVLGFFVAQTYKTIPEHSHFWRQSVYMLRNALLSLIIFLVLLFLTIRLGDMLPGLTMVLFMVSYIGSFLYVLSIVRKQRFAFFRSLDLPFTIVFGCLYSYAILVSLHLNMQRDVPWFFYLQFPAAILTIIAGTLEHRNDA